jgi:hypothetical protein
MLDGHFLKTKSLTHEPRQIDWIKFDRARAANRGLFVFEKHPRKTSSASGPGACAGPRFDSNGFE